MKVNHEKTRNKIFEVAGVLREQANYTKTYKQNKSNVLADETYAEAYKNERVDKLRADYLAHHKEVKERLKNMLNDIMAYELENEAVVEFDVPEYTNTVTTITASGSTLSADVINGIILNFAGHYKILNTLKSIFKKNGIDVEYYNFKEYAMSAGEAVPKLISMVENLEQEENSAIVSLKNLLDAVIHFGKVRGIEFDENSQTLGKEFDGVASNILTRRAMGLPDEV